MVTKLALAVLASCLFGMPAAAQSYTGVVDHVIDGDTVSVLVPAWQATPFYKTSVRIAGIDTPEDRKPPAKCVAEVKKGLRAQAFAKTLLQPGQTVAFTFYSIDKYGGRIDASLKLPDGRDWATVMASAGMAQPYNGSTKPSWCAKSPALREFGRPR